MISLQHPRLDVTPDTNSFPQTAYKTSYSEVTLRREMRSAGGGEGEYFVSLAFSSR